MLKRWQRLKWPSHFGGLVERAHHVEIQVFADNYGHVVHLGERDCSLQRRHQKVSKKPFTRGIPGPSKRHGSGSVTLLERSIIVALGPSSSWSMSTGILFSGNEYAPSGRAPGYRDGYSTRLGPSAVRSCDGGATWFSQSDVSLSGHAIEARLYAENPGKRFLPGPGRVLLWRSPDGVRVDTGVESGTDVSPNYDPMLAKIIAHGPNREVARHKLIHTQSWFASECQPTGLSSFSCLIWRRLKQAKLIRNSSTRWTSH